MKDITRREFLKPILIAGTGLLVSPIFSACVGLEKKVKEISSQTMTLPNVYPAQVNRLFSEIGNVYGNEFVRELKQLPDMKENYTPKKIKALEDIYYVGKEIQKVNSPNAKKAIEDIVEAGADTPTTALISVPLREWYLMHLNKKWNVEDAVEALNSYGKDRWGRNLPDDPNLINSDTSKILNFVLKTDWVFYDEDWKKWEKMGNEYVVLYKKNKDFLISKDQASRIAHTRVDGYVQSPEKTRKESEGDCKAQSAEAADNMEVLQKTGLYRDVKITAFDADGEDGHVFLTYRKNNEKGIFVLDNTGFFPYRGSIRKFNPIIKEECKKIAEQRGFEVEYICAIIEANKKIAEELNQKAQYIWAYDWRTFHSKYPLPHSESLI